MRSFARAFLETPLDGGCAAIIIRARLCTLTAHGSTHIVERILDGLPWPGNETLLSAGTRASATAARFCFRCQSCFQVQPPGFFPKCRWCQGMVEAEYDLSQVQLRESPRTSWRYCDLLPISHPENLLDLGEGQTPCLHAASLGGRWHLPGLHLKCEFSNPTGTAKDRMAAVVLSMFREMGIKEFASCSTGNSSSSLAFGIRDQTDFLMRLYVGGEFKDRVRHVTGNLGVALQLMPEMNFTEVFDFGMSEAERLGIPFEAGFFNPARREGLKLAYFEAVDQVGVEFTHLVQAVSSAMGLCGSWKGSLELVALKRIKTPPKMIGVQQDTCSPLVRAFREGSPTIEDRHIVRSPVGVAKAILRGNPKSCYPHVRDVLLASGGTMVDVSAAEIGQARRDLEDAEGIGCGYCSGAALAGVRKLVAVGEISTSSEVLVNLTD